jgi:hypothetical protein
MSMLSIWLGILEGFRVTATVTLYGCSLPFPSRWSAAFWLWLVEVTALWVPDGPLASARNVWLISAVCLVLALPASIISTRVAISVALIEIIVSAVVWQYDRLERRSSSRPAILKGTYQNSVTDKTHEAQYGQAAGETCHDKHAVALDHSQCH